jgi:hypothetical protein
MPVTSASASPKDAMTLQPRQSSGPQGGTEVRISGDGEIMAEVKILGASQSNVTNTSQTAPIRVSFS